MHKTNNIYEYIRNCHANQGGKIELKIEKERLTDIKKECNADSKQDHSRQIIKADEIISTQYYNFYTRNIIYKREKI